jgi:hypothetical protein
VQWWKSAAKLAIFSILEKKNAENLYILNK